MRGLFILFEGKDRVGKTTQARLLVERLRAAGHNVEAMRFPAREETAVGRVLNEYLTGKHSALPPMAQHLLFTANRAEFEDIIKKKLEEGVTLVVDRYSFSGVAYSAVKGVPVDWAEAVEAPLVKPDVMFLLHCAPEIAAQRAGFGAERHDTLEFQLKLHDVMKDLDASRYAHHAHALTVDNLKIEEVHEEVMRLLAPHLAAN